MKLTSQLSFLSLSVYLFSLLIFNSLYGQDTACPVRVPKEPMTSSQSQTMGVIRESYSINAVSWKNLSNGRVSDNAFISVQLSEFKRTMVLEGRNFGFQVPPHANVSGIMILVEGKASNPQDLSELEVTISGPQDKLSPVNHANDAKSQKAWYAKADGTDGLWMYGSSTDTWGTTWTGADVNSSEFGFNLHLRNALTNNVQIEIDKIEIVVHYTPLYNFCEDNCLTFFIDEYEEFGRYEWKIPQGFRMVSHSTADQAIDLKTYPDTEYGTYNICVDVFDYSNNFVETCCREFVYEDCTSSSISGTVWQDFNNNGIRDYNDGILKGESVFLYNANGIQLASTISDSLGNYAFTNLLNDRYYVKVKTKPNYHFILDNGLDNNTNSDITGAHGIGTTKTITLSIGQHASYIDFGYTPLVSIGDYVWEDLNFNGLQDINETGLPNTRVLLKTKSGNVVDSTITNLQGKYIFNQIPANTYVLQFIPASPNLKSTFINPTNPDKNSKIKNGQTNSLSFFEPITYNDVDAGFYGIGTIGNYVWEDKNGDGIQSSVEQSLAGVKIVIEGQDGSGVQFKDSTITDTYGSYVFSNLKPGIYNITFTAPDSYYPTLYMQGIDAEQDNDVLNGKISNIFLNSQDFLDGFDAGFYRLGQIGDFVWEDLDGNGFQSDNEPGIQNVSVSLEEVRRDTFIFITSTLTDQNGKYLFSNLRPGTYKLTFSTPNGYLYTKSIGIIDDGTNSDVINGMASPVILFSGESETSVDGGLYRPASIGDFVWEDSNANGIQDTGETGISNVTLTLTGNDGAGNAVTLSTTTDTNGAYAFDNLAPGNYTVTLSVPDGYNLSLPNNGNDDTDSDFIGTTMNVTLVSNQSVSNIDAGLYRNASIGDFVWEDSNANGIQDTGETGISNVTLTLTGNDGAGNAVTLSTTTDTNGAYAFDNLAPGNYTVTLSVPNGYNLSLPNNGNDDTDSDFIGITVNVTLVSNQSVSNIDAGLYRNASIGDFIWEDSNANGIQDTGETGISNVTLTLTGNDGAETQ
ncbi:MAG: SdrD B-like domain-containing protein [Saprospiraceae bacterium]